MMHRSAVISECGKYRYRLSRSWGMGPRVCWLMLNPSTADAEKDDPTIRRCIGFTARWGYLGCEVINLFAYRATDPAELLKVNDPIGWDNAKYQADAIRESALLMCAWGCESTYRKMVRAGWRPMAIVDAIQQSRPQLSIECLGMSPSGNPYHPLMLPYSAARIPFEVKLGS